MTSRLIRGRLLSFKAAPKGIDDHESYSYVEDGGLLIENGLITAAGDYQTVVMPPRRACRKPITVRI